MQLAFCLGCSFLLRCHRHFSWCGLTLTRGNYMACPQTGSFCLQIPFIFLPHHAFSSSYGTLSPFIISPITLCTSMCVCSLYLLPSPQPRVSHTGRTEKYTLSKWVDMLFISVGWNLLFSCNDVLGIAINRHLKLCEYFKWLSISHTESQALDTQYLLSILELPMIPTCLFSYLFYSVSRVGREEYGRGKTMKSSQPIESRFLKMHLK